MMESRQINSGNHLILTTTTSTNNRNNNRNNRNNNSNILSFYILSTRPARSGVSYKQQSIKPHLYHLYFAIQKVHVQFFCTILLCIVKIKTGKSESRRCRKRRLWLCNRPFGKRSISQGRGQSSLAFRFNFQGGEEYLGG